MLMKRTYQLNVLEIAQKIFSRRKENQISIRQFLDDTPSENKFKDNLLGGGWYKAFIKTYPDIETRKSEGVLHLLSKI